MIPQSALSIPQSAPPLQTACIVPFRARREAKVPDEDSAELSSWGPSAAAEVRQWLALFEAILTAPGKRGLAVARIAKAHGLSARTLQNKFSTWNRDGDWRTLVNRSKYKAVGEEALPRAFLEFWRGLIDARVGRQKNKVKAAHRNLLARLARWEKGDDTAAIPGYTTPPPRQLTTGKPVGWGYEALNKKAQSAAERRLRDHGPKAYSGFMPSNLTTRVGLEPGQMYMFDDQEFDVEVVFDLAGLGMGQLMRPLAFHALDVASACDFARVFKAQLVGADGKRRKLSEEDFLWFVVHVLCDIGYRADIGTMLVVENGTAAIKADFEECLYHATNGKVRVSRSSLFGSPAFQGMMFRGPGSGNFRHKAARESWFNILRIAMAALPGQTGRNRDTRPEEMEGSAQYTRWLLKAALELSPERQTLLMLPRLSWSHFGPLVHDLCHRINTRTDHHCEGWEKSGYVLNEVSPDGQLWLPASALRDTRLGEAQRAQLALAAQIPGHCRPRRMSPQEVWQERGLPRLTRVPAHLIPQLIPERFAKEARVGDDLCFTVKDQLVEEDDIIYIAQARNAHGHEINLKRGETYLLYFNPCNPSTAQVCTAHGSLRGAWIGTVQRFIPAMKLDEEEVMKNYGRLSHAVAPERAAVERRARAVMFGRQTMKEWNARVLDTKTPLTPGEKKRDALSREAGDALAEAAAALPAPSHPLADDDDDPFL